MLILYAVKLNCQPIPPLLVVPVISGTLNSARTSLIVVDGEIQKRGFLVAINSSDSWDWLCNAASKHFNRALLAITLAPLEPKRRRSAQMAFKPTWCGIFKPRAEPPVNSETNKKKHISIKKKGMNSAPFSQTWVFFVHFSWQKIWSCTIHHHHQPTGEQHQASSVHTLLTQRSTGKIM